MTETLPRLPRLPKCSCVFFRTGFKITDPDCAEHGVEKFVVHKPPWARKGKL